MACYKYQNEVACMMLNRDADYTGVPLLNSGYPWHNSPVLSSRQEHDNAAAEGRSSYCQGQAAGSCFGVDVAVDALVVAISGTGANATRYVQVGPRPAVVRCVEARAAHLRAPRAGTQSASDATVALCRCWIWFTTTPQNPAAKYVGAARRWALRPEL